MSETCSICLEEIPQNEIYILKCSHKLHNNCYNSLMKSNGTKKCPLCRTDIVNTSCCSLCNQEMNFKYEACEVFLAKDCGCYFHYNCLKREKKRDIFCVKCEKDINIENIEALSYLYFNEQYVKWIGSYPRCKENDCTWIGNPQRFGYCSKHGITTATNRATMLAFVFFTRFINEDNLEKRQNIFVKIVEYMNLHHRYNDIEELDFEKIREKLIIKI